MRIALVALLALSACVSPDDTALLVKAVSAPEACAEHADAWCEAAVACDSDTLVRGPEDFDRCVAGVTDACLADRTADVAGSELAACLDAIDAQVCSPSFGLPAECDPLWHDPVTARPSSR